MILLSTAHPAKFLDIIDVALPKHALAVPHALNAVLQKQKQAAQIRPHYATLKKILFSPPSRIKNELPNRSRAAGYSWQVRDKF